MHYMNIQSNFNNLRWLVALKWNEIQAMVQINFHFLITLHYTCMIKHKQNIAVHHRNRYNNTVAIIKWCTYFFREHYTLHQYERIVNNIIIFINIKIWEKVEEPINEAEHVRLYMSPFREENQICIQEWIKGKNNEFSARMESEKEREYDRQGRRRRQNELWKTDSIKVTLVSSSTVRGYIEGKDPTSLWY